jgi:proteasome lid subunit RPN8/RPN11
MTDEPVRVRIDPQPDLPPVKIHRVLLNELYSHALEADPEECCGLITGTAAARLSRAHRCRNDMTLLHESDPVAYPRHGRRAFHMNETDYMNVDRDAKAHSEVVTGVYHSHVNAGAGVYFSEMDQSFAAQELFPFPDASHIVLSVSGRIVTTGVFDRDRSTGLFVGRTVEAI